MTGNNNEGFDWIGSRPVRPDGVDKVTGRAQYGADMTVPNMVVGRVLRSPHAHARINSIDASAALAIEGVLAVVTSADFQFGIASLGAERLEQISPNLLARDKVLYQGHAVAAVAAISERIAEQALQAIHVQYDSLPPVLTIEAAMAGDAPLLHETMYTKGYPATPSKPSNIAERNFFEKGDVDLGFAAADLIVEKTYTVPRVHQGFIEPFACVAEASRDGKIRIWCSTQGQFDVRLRVATLLDVDVGDVTVTASEIGGGFGAKTTVYLEPVAAALSRKCLRPVKMVMSRDEVFRASGPAPGASVKVRIGATKDGDFTAMDAQMYYDVGAFTYSNGSVMAAAFTVFACYDCANVRTESFEVVTNKPRGHSYRAPGAPQAAVGAECVINELAAILNIDPIELRLRNAADDGTATVYGAVFNEIGLKECLRRAAVHPHYQSALAANQGRGVAAGFWFNVGKQSSVTMHLTESGRLIIDEGSPDIGGSRASLAMIAAEVLGVDYDKVSIQVKDTDSIGFNFHTGGSRTTYATGWAVRDAALSIIEKLCARAARVWGVEREEVEWRRAAVVQSSDLKTRLSLKELVELGDQDSGPITVSAAVNIQSVSPSFGVSIADVEVDLETGASKVSRFTSLQDAGKAVHPDFVEGQLQGGAVQGIGWALNEEYLYDENGVMENAGFLDYRIPVASDLPMIDTEIIEVPAPEHPFGVRGVGETPIVSSPAAVCTAVSQAAGVVIRDLPLAPWRVLQAIHGVDG